MAEDAQTTRAPDERIIDLTEPPVTRDALLRAWMEGIRNRHVLHGSAAARYENRGRALGVLAVGLSTVVGTAIFASLTNSPDPWVEVGAGLLSLLAAIVAAVQTALSYPQLAERHRTAAIKYGDLRRSLELRLVAEGVPAQLEELKRRWEEADSGAPPIPPSMRRRIFRSIGDA